MLERPWQPRANHTVRIQVFIERSAFVAYVDGYLALSTRGYDHPTGQLGTFVSEGSAAFRDLKGWTRQ